MACRRTLPFIACLLAAGLPGRAQSQAVLPDSFYPSGFPATYKSVLDGARKLWQKDAVATNVEVQGVFGYPTAWLRFDLYSPSTGFFAAYNAGGPMNGQSTFSYIQPINRSRLGDPLPPDLKVDLTEAIATLRKAGYKGALGLISLSMRGAHGTQPLPAWSIRVGGQSITAPPIFINAQDGKLIPVHRAMDPAPGSDAELQAIYGAAMRRMQGGGGGAGNGGHVSPSECVAMLQMGFLGCP
jgi:hypothetical protein